MSKEESSPREIWKVSRIEGNIKVPEYEFPDVFSAAEYVLYQSKDGYVRIIEKVLPLQETPL